MEWGGFFCVLTENDTLIDTYVQTYVLMHIFMGEIKKIQVFNKC